MKLITEQVDLERVRRVAAIVTERGRLKAEDAMQLIEAGIPIYSYVDRAAVEAGEVKELPPEVLQLI